MKTIYPSTESLTVEFKSDRNGYPDQELIEALTCLANTAGGELWLGMEDNGTPSGVHRKHQNIAHLTALIAAQTRPALTVNVSLHSVRGVLVAKILVPKSSTMIATLGGVYLLRRLKPDGTPECIHIDPDGYQ